MTSRVGHRHARAASNGMGQRPRILTAVPICDGHDSAIMTVNLELARHGIEVVYLGYHRSVRDIVRAAIQEGVQGVGLSSYNGGHVEFFTEVLSGLRRLGARGVGLFGGGGGTITPEDARLMIRRGVDKIFFPGAALTAIAEWIRRTYGGKSEVRSQKSEVLRGGRGEGESEVRSQKSDLGVARLLSAVEAGVRIPVAHVPRPPPVIGITGPGGAGKTTLIDEMVLRLLSRWPHGRLAILSHDPATLGHGALLGDRATLVYAQDDRVFMRSLAAREGVGGLAPATRRCLQVLRCAGFDLILVETTGIGQETLPFGHGLVDKQVLVMSPDYGARLQLQKIAMLDVADVVVLNKADLPGARTALGEIEQRLALNQQGSPKTGDRQDACPPAQRLFTTVARRHGDPGVDQLVREVAP